MSERESCGRAIACIPHLFTRSRRTTRFPALLATVLYARPRPFPASRPDPFRLFSSFRPFWVPVFSIFPGFSSRFPPIPPLSHFRP